MKSEKITKAYELAKERYAEYGIDTEKVLAQLQDFHLSMHCWQADDVSGFEVQAGASRAESRVQVTIPARHATSTNCAPTSSRQRASSPAHTD